MRKQIMHVSVNQSSKVIASVYALVVLLIAIPVALYSLFHHDWGSAIMLLIFTPIFYWVVFYIGHAIGFLLYNFIAQRMGGIEFDLKDLDLRSVPIEEPIRSVNEGEPVNPDRVDTL